MKTSKRTQYSTLAVLLLVSILFLSIPADTYAAIAKITSFRGEVLVQSGTDVSRLRRVGYVLNSGDYVLTKQGEAQITFNDGAVTKLNPFSKTMIQERDEESGFWVFKTKKATRRVTVYVGKIWHKSGVSDKRNFVQTPTAVCGLRGSDGDFGYDPVKLASYLNMYSGEAAVVGTVIRGFFDNPGITAAQKSAVYQALANAYTKTEAAKATGKTLDLAQAKVDALNVAKEAASALKDNPETTVKTQANAALATADASIAAAKAVVDVERIKEAKAAAERERNEKAAKEAELAAKKAEEAAAKAAAAAAEAKAAADRLEVERAQKAAEAAQKALDDANKAAEGVVPTTAPPTTAPPTTAPPTTAPPTTAPPTTAPPATEPPPTVTTMSITTTTTTTTTSCPSPG